MKSKFIRPLVYWRRLSAVVFSATLLAGSTAPARADTFLRGDADGNGVQQITDAILVLGFLFTGGDSPVCAPVADSNADGAVNISDPVALLRFLFLGRSAPPSLSQYEVNTCKGLDPDAIERGRTELEKPDPNGNQFACTTCHSLEPEGETEILRAGHTLLNSLGRPSYKSGGRASFVGAVNVCRNDWMAVGDPAHNFDFVPWTEDEPRFKDLVAFIESVSMEETSPALSFEIVPPAKSGPSTGDATRGCRLFNRSCGVCHGASAIGSLLAPSLVDVESLCNDSRGLCLNASCEPSTSDCLDNPDFIRYRIRLSGPESPGSVYHAPQGFDFAGTVMPFWSKDKLTDAQVEDLVAFVAKARDEARAGKTTLDCSSNPSPEGKVLRRGTLSTREEGVAGVVEELDTRKIRINNFSYRGGGILVRVWLFKSGKIRGGRAIGPDIFGQVMRNTTFVVEIPADVTSDSFDSVSIWCVVAKADFGSAKLEALP